MMKRTWLTLTTILIGCVVIGIMTKKPATTAQKTGGDTFRMALTSEPANLDPARGVDVNEGCVQAKLFDGLVRFDEKMKLVGDLAESWDIKDEGKTYVFHLRHGVTFHDGKPFSARDVVFSFNRLLDPAVKSPRTWVLEKVSGARERLAGTASDVSGISAPDESTVKITLVEPFAPFISLLTMPACYVLPADSAEMISDRSFFEKPSGTGPYTMVGRERDSFIRLAANPTYHGPKPTLETIELRIIPENMKAEMEFETGNLDLLQLFPSNYDRLAGKSENTGRIRDVPAMNVFYLGLNNQKPPFNDIHIRKALNMLIDREAIIKAVYKGRASVAHGSIPPGIIGHSQTAPGFPFDPKQGSELLKEAGFDKKHPLKFDLFQKSSQAAFEVTRLIQGEFKKYGVQVTLRPMEWSALKDAIDKGEATAFYLSWYGDYPDGENFLFPVFHSQNWGSGGNRACYKSAAVDSMIGSALHIQDTAKRAEAYDKVNRTIVDDAPWVYLWHLNESYLLGPRVESIEMSPLFGYDKGLTVTMRK
ncbi:MAG: ABC transporter substrate-binding protein [Candidatus Riflebacteria bacterium]|nr:ABC transporter substrate-binding protein [Candidatus Riflebacteria bacterium]